MELPKDGVCMVSNRGALAYKLGRVIQVGQAPKKPSPSSFGTFAMESKKVQGGENSPKAPSSSLGGDDVFQKLKNSLFQDAFELCLLFGAQVCIIASSPDGGKPITFGYPSVEVVANRFLNRGPPSNANPDPHWERMASILRRYYDVIEHVDGDENLTEEADELWETDVFTVLGAADDELKPDQVDEHKNILEKFWDKVDKRLEEVEVKIEKGLSLDDTNAADPNPNPTEGETRGS